MVIDILIKSYNNDFAFLEYAVKSIHKYLSGYRYIIIVLDTEDMPYIRDYDLESVNIIFVDRNKDVDGYIWQQYIKLNAHKYTNAEYILFSDSDFIFNKHTDIRERYINEGKIRLMRTPYSDVGDAIVWKNITAKVLNYESEYEYMRQLPLMYSLNTLYSLHNDYPQLNDYILSIKDRSFSEFNVLGQYIERNDIDNYEIIDTRERILEPIGKQYWSWGGIEEVKDEIKKIIDENN